MADFSDRICEQIVEVPFPQVAEQFFGESKSHAERGDSRQASETVYVSGKMHVCSDLQSGFLA